MSRSLTRARVMTHCCIAAGMLLAIAVISPLLGGGISLLAALGSTPWGDYATPDAQIFWATRVPRVLTAIFSGGDLALAGLAYQAVLRNPLAEPYVLGISAGAGMGK